MCEPFSWQKLGVQEEPAVWLPQYKAVSLTAGLHTARLSPCSQATYAMQQASAAPHGAYPALPSTTSTSHHTGPVHATVQAASEIPALAFTTQPGMMLSLGAPTYTSKPVVLQVPLFV